MLTFSVDFSVNKGGLLLSKVTRIRNLNTTLRAGKALEDKVSLKTFPGKSAEH